MDVLEQLTAEEADEASLHPDTDGYRIVTGHLWPDPRPSDRVPGHYFFHTPENAVVDRQHWSLCVLEIIEIGEVLDVEITERHGYGWYSLSTQ
jgi:hypothetical protein